MTDTRPAADPNESGAPFARHGQQKRHGVWASLFKVLAAVTAVVLVSTGAVAAVAVWSVTSQLQPGVELVGEDEVPDIGAIEGGVNVLLVGSDSGEGNPAYGERGHTLNDVTMLLHISEDHSRATVVSFPRDMFVPIPACPSEDGGTYSAMTSQKMNTTLTYGGLACTVLTVQKLTGMDIPFAAQIEFDGVIEMSNAVGGVPVCVATDIRDNMIGFHLDAGEHVLSGHDALQFVRTRYGVGDGSDISRISNQQAFLSSLVRTLKSADTLSDPTKVWGIAQAAVRNMKLSNSLQNLNTLASIAIALKDIELEDVVFVQYPGDLGTRGAQSGVIPRTADAEKLFTALKNDQPIEVTGTTGGGTVTDKDTDTGTDTGTDAGTDEDTADEQPQVEAGAENPDAATGAPTPGAPQDTTVELPSSVKGQTAATQTCSKGR